MLIVVKLKKKSFIAIDHSLSHYNHHCNYKNNFVEILKRVVVCFVYFILLRFGSFVLSICVFNILK
jgi:hypothetical protein